jgi:hypothetical protein
MAGVANIPWYATLFRGDQFEAALREIAPIALRYGATDYEVLRSNDDRYRFMQLAYFDDKDDFERYWYGPEFNEWRADYTSWFQVPVVYGFFDRVTRGHLNGNGNGNGNAVTGRASAQTEDF